MNIAVIKQTYTLYPSALKEVLKKDALETITAIGSPGILKQSKLAIFCSNQCPGAAKGVSLHHTTRRINLTLDKQKKVKGSNFHYLQT